MARGDLRGDDPRTSTPDWIQAWSSVFAMTTTVVFAAGVASHFSLATESAVAAVAAAWSLMARRRARRTRRTNRAQARVLDKRGWVHGLFASTGTALAVAGGSAWHSDYFTGPASLLLLAWILAWVFMINLVVWAARDVHHGWIVSTLSGTLALAAIVGSVAVLTDDRAWPMKVVGVVQGWGTADHPGSAASPTHDPNGGTNSPTPGPVPTVSSPQDPCPANARTKAAFTEGVGDGSGEQLFAAWAVQPHDLVGCPTRAPFKVGHIWVTLLAGGSEPADYVVGTPNGAAVIFDDFQSLVQRMLGQVADVSDRSRWGLGTMQLVYRADRSCVLLEAYGRDAAIEVPPAVTELVARTAHRLGGFPKIVAVGPRQPGRYDVMYFLPTDDDDGHRHTPASRIDYRHGAATVEGTDARADDGPCTAPALTLGAVGARLEESVQAARARGRSRARRSAPPPG